MFILSTGFHKGSGISNFMEIHPAEPPLIHADRQKDMTKLTNPFGDYAKRLRVKNEVNLSLPTPRRHMREAEVQLHSFSTSAPDKDEWSD